MQRLIRPLYLAVLALGLTSMAYAAISGEESSVSGLSGINEAETYNSTVTSVRTYSQQYEDTITELATVDAHIATMRANLNTHPDDADSANYRQYRTAYFQMLDRAGDLRNKAMALDMLISGQKLNDSSTTGQALTDAEYSTLKSRLDAAEKQAKAVDVELKALQTRLDNNDPTASYAMLDALYDESDKAYDMAHNLRDILNNSTNPDGSPSVVYVPSTSSGSSNNSSGSGSGNSTMDTIKGAVLQGVLGSLGGGSGGGMNLGSFGGIQKAISGMNIGGAQVGNIKPDTASVADKPKAPVKQTASKDKSCKEAAADASAKAALPERDDSGKIIKSSGAATTDTAPGKAADDAVMGSTKPDCVGVNYTKKNPESDGSPKNELGVTSMEEAMALIESRGGTCDHDTGLCKGGGCIGKNCSCASLPRTEINAGTPSWRQGDPITPSTPVGTWVATFNNGDLYGTDKDVTGESGKSHTGMFLGFNQQTGAIILMDQFKKGSLGIREYSCNGGLEGCDKYYTIKTPGSAWLDFIPLLQPVVVALRLPPLDMGLLKS